MKKVNIKILATLLAIICISTTFTIFSSAAVYTGRFSFIDVQYTSKTNIYCYSAANYTGEYFGNANSYCLLYADCRGGDVSTFTTTLYIFIADGISSENVYKTSDDTGSKTLDGKVQRFEYEMIPSANGYVEEDCYNKTDNNDFWRCNYLRRWIGGQVGWVSN